MSLATWAGREACSSLDINGLDRGSKSHCRICIQLLGKIMQTTTFFFLIIKVSQSLLAISQVQKIVRRKKTLIIVQVGGINYS